MSRAQGDPTLCSRRSSVACITNAAAMATTTAGSMLATRKVLGQIRLMPMQKMRVDPVDAVIVWTVDASVMSCISRKGPSTALFDIFE